MQHFLEAISGSLRGMQLPIGRRIIIGRDPESDVQLVERGVSRQHAAILVDDSERLFVMDLASSNGTFLNETSVGRGELAVDDCIRIGESEFILRYGEPTILPEDLEARQLRLASGPATGVTRGEPIDVEELARLRELYKR